MSKAPCGCSVTSLILPKAGACPPIPPCPVCGCDPCRCARPCPSPCPPPCPPPRHRPCPVCGCDPCRYARPCPATSSCACGCEKQSCGRYLINRVVGCGSCHERRVCQRLCLERVPRAAVPPFTLVCVSACAQNPWWEELPCEMRGTMLLLVSVPLTCTFCDARGEQFQTSATLERRVRIRLSCGSAECWRYQTTVQACVRLLENVCGGPDGCFDAPLEALIDVYMTAACLAGRPEPPDCCFDARPLFPPPCRPY